MGKYIKGIATGMVVGAAVGIMMMPQFDRKTKRQLKKIGKRAMNMAEDTYDNIKHLRK